MKSLQLIILTLICLNALPGYAQTKSFNYPGGVIEILLDKQSAFLPEVQYGIHEPTIIEQKNSWRILIGLGLDTIPGEYLVYLKRNTENASSEHIKFSVEQKNYPIKVLKQRPTKAIKQVHLSLSKLDYKNTQQPNLPLKFPAEGNWNFEFGSIFYNQKNKKVDTQNQIFIETNSIINVRAPENALISNLILEKDGSSTVFLDHGRGLYSVISGITDINVEIGNGVLSGSVIGKVTPITNSKKSVITPRTLTWQCILNGIYVNPTILTKL